MHSFEILQHLNFSEIYWLTLYRAQLKGKKIRILLIATPVLIGVLTGIIQSILTDGNHEYLTPVFIGLMIISYIIIFISKFNRNKKQQPYKLLVQPDGIECISKKGISRMNWSQITCYMEFPHHLLLLSSDVSEKTTTILVQKSAFTMNPKTDLYLPLQEHGVQKR